MCSYGSDSEISSNDLGFKGVNSVVETGGEVVLVQDRYLWGRKYFFFDVEQQITATNIIITEKA